MLLERSALSLVPQSAFLQFFLHLNIKGNNAEDLRDHW